MGIEIFWIEDEKNILCWKFRGQWSLDEFRDATQQTLKIIEPIDRFDLVFDAIGAKTPRFPMAEFQRVLNIPVVKRDYLVIVTQDLFILSILSVLRKIGVPNLSKDRLDIANNMQEAFAKIHDNRELLMIE